MQEFVVGQRVVYGDMAVIVRGAAIVSGRYVYRVRIIGTARFVEGYREVVCLAHQLADIGPLEWWRVALA